MMLSLIFIPGGIECLSFHPWICTFPDYGFPNFQILDFQCWNLVFFITTSGMHSPRTNKTIPTVIDQKLPNCSQIKFISCHKFDPSIFSWKFQTIGKMVQNIFWSQCRKVSWAGTKSLFNSQISPTWISNHPDSNLKSSWLESQNPDSNVKSSRCESQIVNFLKTYSASDEFDHMIQLFRINWSDRSVVYF